MIAVLLRNFCCCCILFFLLNAKMHANSLAMNPSYLMPYPYLISLKEDKVILSYFELSYYFLAHPLFQNLQQLHSLFRNLHWLMMCPHCTQIIPWYGELHSNHMVLRCLPNHNLPVSSLAKNPL